MKQTLIALLVALAAFVFQGCVAPVAEDMSSEAVSGVSDVACASIPEAVCTPAPKDGNVYARWSRGIDPDPNYFPIAVWVQNPARAARYKAAGVNLYVGLWNGPTAEQIAQLKAADMPVICSLNAWAREHLDEPTIVGWMHGDEPDNAQLIDRYWKNDRQAIREQWPEYSAEQVAAMSGYGPGAAPHKIIADYEELKAIDPTRPILMNLGQSVAWTNWYGRGPRSGHTEDYPKYARGGDIISFDIYPANHSREQFRGQLWYVPFGLSRLATWTQGRKPVWQCVEASPIHLAGPEEPVGRGKVRTDHVPTAREIRNEVWASIIHGSKGIIYFVHQFQPKFNEAYVLSDPELLAGFTAVNTQVQALAAVINAPSVDNLATVWFPKEDLPVKAVAKVHEGWVYIFAAAMRSGETPARFTVYGVGDKAEVEVIGEDRTLTCAGRSFTDEFKDWDVHLYRIKADGFEGFSME